MNRWFNLVGLLVLCCVATHCKSASPERNDLSGFLDILGPFPDNIGCGPAKTWYFHWMDSPTANLWLKAVGSQALPQEQKLMPRSRPWKSVNDELIDSLVEHASMTVGGGVAGPGIYLSARPIGSMEYGEAMLLFRLSKADGKGFDCDFDRDFKDKNRFPYAKGKDRAPLPLLVMYMKPSSMDKWYILPRTADPSRGERAVFDWPHQGDADLVAEEMVSGASREQLLANVYALGVPYSLYSSAAKDQQALLHDLCAQTPETNARAFLQDFFCRAVPGHLSQKIAGYPSRALTFNEQGLVKKMETLFGGTGMNVPAMKDILQALR